MDLGLLILHIKQKALITFELLLKWLAKFQPNALKEKQAS